MNKILIIFLIISMISISVIPVQASNYSDSELIKINNTANLIYKTNEKHELFERKIIITTLIFFVIFS